MENKKVLTKIFWANLPLFGGEG